MTSNVEETTEKSAALPLLSAKGEAGDSDWIVCAEDGDVTYVGDTCWTDELTWRDAKQVLARSCSWHAWKQRFPILLWLPNYSWSNLKADVIAGITVGITTIPQALAYAQIAGLPLEYGLYSSFMGCFVYSILGTSKDIQTGVVAVVSLLTSAAIPKDVDMYERTKYAVLLAFLTGLVQMAMGLLHLGFLFNFVSHPVLSGFTTAAGFVIMFSQIKNIMGIKGAAATDTVIQQGTNYVQNIGNIRGWDVLMGMVCLSALLLLKQAKVPSKGQPFLRETIRVLLLARYGVVVVFATLIGFLLDLHQIPALALTADVDTKLPALAVPVLEWRNKTLADNVLTVLPAVPFIVLVSSIETIAIAKAFSSRFQYTIDPSQELMALGAANFISSFVSAYPIAGSFTRSSVNAQSGVKTPLGSAVTGLFVVLAQATISPAFRFVPKAALGAVIVVAVLILLDFKIFKELWATRKAELVPLAGTILSSLFLGLDTGFLIGIVLSLALLLLSTTRPKLRIERQQQLLLSKSKPSQAKRVIETRLQPDGDIFFPATEAFKHFLDTKLFRHKALTAMNGGVGEKVLKYRTTSLGGTVAQGQLPLSAVRDAVAPEVTQHIRSMQTEEVLILQGSDLDKLDFTSLTTLHFVIEQYQNMGHALRFQDASVPCLRQIVPKRLRYLIPQYAERCTITIKPPTWKQHRASLSIPKDFDVEEGESTAARRRSVIVQLEARQAES
ncbi:hypothetical protein RvY_03425 [Ramazzottius varieornatus]|uniref:SLC26A/SulP transporter domain-containing protein n=1 Tax=Ramazzottius varieornatus TaxID=947166 RepID=A0A1D1UN17_RAMVA|nr:hypothetical protein RvY_03425 [Ramazzottius varieornatus]